MEEYGPETYGERIAAVYDELFHPPTSTVETVEFLAKLAADGPMLELAIGTGRIALPLAAKGVEVHGIDASEAMVAKLRAKPGGNDIPITIGDFADVGVEGRYRLIAIVFNTLWALLTQEAQARCLRNVAAHLTEDGAFVTEMYMPDPARFDRGQRIQVRNIESRRVVLETSLHDPANQRVSSQLIALEDGGGGISMYPVELRYIWPSELDLMAEHAGLRLRERWGGWKREPFDATRWCISVFEPART
jgi:methyltransferase family protein